MINKSNKRKVLFVIPSLSSGGAERVICHIVNYISREKYDVNVLLIKGGEHAYLNNLKNDVKVHFLNYNGRIRYSILKVLRGIVRIKPDTVFMGFGELNLLISVFIPFFKKYKWIARETNTVTERIQSKVIKKAYSTFYTNYDLIIAQCKDMEVDLVANLNIPPSKIMTIYNPIDNEFIDNKLSDNLNNPFDSKKINLLSCGRLTYQKGFDLLIDEFAKFKQKDKYKLTIIGSGDHSDPENQEDLLRSKISQFGLEKNITIIPFNNNIFQWMYYADIFILSSRYEGFSNVLLESLHCGTPALVNDCKGGVREVILPGKNGDIFSIQKEGELEGQIEYLIKNKPSNKIVSQSAEKYKILRIVENYNKIL